MGKNRARPARPCFAQRVGCGFGFTVAASTTQHTLYIGAGGFATRAKLTAHLSDGSATDFAATPSSGDEYINFLTITFAAASAYQTLTITYTRTQRFASGGSIDSMGGRARVSELQSAHSSQALTGVAASAATLCC